MKIAVLVLAHKNLGQLNRLVSHLAQDFDVYVHIDKKSSIKVGQVVQSPNVFVHKKFKISWGSLEMVKATLHLMKESCSKGYGRYIVISGQDLPLRNNKDIRDFFSENNSSEFISGLNLKFWDKGGLERVEYFHAPSPVGSHGLIRTNRLVLNYSMNLANRALGVKRQSNWDFYCGSNWFDLSSRAVEAILRHVSSNPEFIKRFRWTACCDEIFFQTALALQGFEDKFQPSPLRYIDWKTGPEHPRTLRQSDLNELVHSEMLFARKFDQTVDPDIIDALYARLQP